MALTDRDPHNARETARVIYLAAKAVRLEARGKSTRAIEREIDRIRETAQAREDARTARRAARRRR
ncbi:hypothetical protein K7472_24840 [Streptomyces sp. PTM05]|uniref:Uncharacterized protein n=1 Tax=Streptantibioticus parmotrematis TaxID=2873249 RepID=A0ABS7QXV7_9ACTN|nr:hypothetical protein [Streptantibioticus parmotrematis]MBY8888042.1 hypothetical protein [Streptantibioticus parmotrematis]